MQNPKLRIPHYCKHKHSGLAYVKIAGHRTYLGPYGSKESRDKYDQILSEWLAQGRQCAPTPVAASQGGLTIAELLAAFLPFLESYYRLTDGTQTKEVPTFKAAMKILRMYAIEPARAFGPIKLQACQQAMITKGWARPYINQQISRIKKIFRWAVSRELVPGEVYHALAAVEGLKAGRSQARETEPVRPVSPEDVAAVLPLVSQQIAAMIRIQQLTGARPGEVCIMRTADIDRSGPVWIYKPQHHKTEHHGLSREIAIGPKGQAILTPFLKPNLPDAFVFSPAEAEAARNHRRSNPRRHLSPSAARRRRRQRSEGMAGQRYTVDSYRRAISRACDLAHPVPQDLDDAAAKVWRRVHRWHPHQLRHTVATEIRKRFGLEGAQVVLGHQSANVTQVYAELDRAKAIQIMADLG